MSTFTISSQHCTGDLSQCNKARKHIQIRKEVKLPLLKKKKKALTYHQYNHVCKILRNLPENYRIHHFVKVSQYKFSI